MHPELLKAAAKAVGNLSPSWTTTSDRLGGRLVFVDTKDQIVSIALLANPQFASIVWC